MLRSARPFVIAIAALMFALLGCNFGNVPPEVLIATPEVIYVTVISEASASSTAEASPPAMIEVTPTISTPFPTPDLVTMTVVNTTDKSICSLMAGPPNSDGGGDLLNPHHYTGMGDPPNQPTPTNNLSIPAGGSVSITLGRGSFLTFMAFPCDNSGKLADLAEVQVTEDFTWRVGE